MRYAIACLSALLVLAPTHVCFAQQNDSAFAQIPWTRGPEEGKLGSQAEVQVPKGCLFTGKDGTRQFMELTQNPPDAGELGVVLCQSGDSVTAEPWFVVFSFDGSGYVRDDQRNELDANAILKSIRAGTEEANKERKRRGWGALTIEGWVTRPHYDVKTHNLTWALSALDEQGSESVNQSVRLLGRSGVMRVDLVTSPKSLAALLPAFDDLIGSFAYLPGHRYAEWRKGDKVASYGLTALVAGGVGAVAVKTGLLAKLWKMLAAGVVAVLAAIKRWWRRLTGRGKEPQAA